MASELFVEWLPGDLTDPRRCIQYLYGRYLKQEPQRSGGLKDLLSVKEVSDLLGLSVGYIRELLIEGQNNPKDPSKLHGAKPGGRDWVIERSEVERFRQYRRRE